MDSHLGEVHRTHFKNNSFLHINTEDVRLTEKIVDAGYLLNVDVLDHLIVCHNRFVSLKERGLGFRS